MDPVIEQAQLTASDGAAGDSLGLSVAISASGNTIVAAAGAATVNGNPGQGAVYVFTRPAGGWQDATQAAKLTASDGAAFDNLGSNSTEGENGVAILQREHGRGRASGALLWRARRGVRLRQAQTAAGRRRPRPPS